MTLPHQLESSLKEGSISSNYSGTITDFIPVENEKGKKVELTKYQIVKAELINIEE